MYIYTYTAKNKNEITKRIQSFKVSLSILESLKNKDFKTLNEAWRSIVKTRLTKRELDKFCKLLGDNIHYSLGRYGNQHYEFYVKSENWQNNITFLNVSITESLNIDRHYCGNSLNIAEHTIESLIETCKNSIKDYEKAFKLYDSIKMRVDAYEHCIAEAVKNAHNQYIKDIAELVDSRSI